MADEPLKEQPSRIRTGLKNVGMATLKGVGGAIGSVVKGELSEATGQIGAGFGAGFSRERDKQSKEANDARKSAIKSANLAGATNKVNKSASDTSKSNNVDEATKKQSIFNEDMVQQTKILADSIVSIDQRVDNLEIGQRNIQTDINRIMFMLEEIKGPRSKGVADSGPQQQQQIAGVQNPSLLQSLLTSAISGALAPVLARVGASLVAATKGSGALSVLRAALLNPLALAAGGVAALAYNAGQGRKERPEDAAQFDRTLRTGGERSQVIQGPEAEREQFKDTPLPERAQRLTDEQKKKWLALPAEEKRKFQNNPTLWLKSQSEESNQNSESPTPVGKSKYSQGLYDTDEQGYIPESTMSSNRKLESSIGPDGGVKQQLTSGIVNERSEDRSTMKVATFAEKGTQIGAVMGTYTTMDEEGSNIEEFFGQRISGGFMKRDTYMFVYKGHELELNKTQYFQIRNHVEKGDIASAKKILDKLARREEMRKHVAAGGKTSTFGKDVNPTNTSVDAAPVGSENVTGVAGTPSEAMMAAQEQQRQAPTLAEQKDLNIKGNEVDIDSKTELNLTGRSIKIEGTGSQTILFKSPNIKFEADKIEFVYAEKSERKVAASGVTPTDNQTGGATPDAAGGGATPVTPPADGGTTPPAAGGAAGGGTTPGGAPVTATTGSNKQILDTIKKRESGNNYTAKARGSTASGAYQFINRTWSALTKKFNIGTEYATARDAPPEIQDKVADAYISDILRRANGDVSKVPLEWYTGNINGNMSASALAANRGLTPQAYQAGWMAEYARQGGKIKKAGDTPGATPTGSAPATTAPAATPTTPSGGGGGGAEAPSGAGGGAGAAVSPEAAGGGATAERAESATPGGTATPGATPSGTGGGNVRQAQSGTRRLPINNKLNSVLASAARAAGVDVTVTSGGQPAFPKGPRVGSTRHDLGNAADVDLYSGGKVLSDTNPADVELKKKFVTAATSAGASGVGAGMGYMGATKIHVGFGTRAKWGGAPWLSGVTPGSGTASEGSGTPSSGGGGGGGGGGGTPAASPPPVTPSSGGGGGGSSASNEDSPNAQMSMASPDTGTSLNERSSTAEVDTRIGNMKTPQNQTPSTKVIQNNVQQSSSGRGNQHQDQQSLGSFMAAPDESYFTSSGFTSVTPDPAFYGPGGKSGFSAGRLG